MEFMIEFMATLYEKLVEITTFDLHVYWVTRKLAESVLMWYCFILKVFLFFMVFNGTGIV